MNNLEKEFVPYTEALELKRLGFDEPCMASRDMNNKEGIIQIPLYQQAFRWFREKYDLFISITHYENGYSINDLRRFDTYEEAELTCLRKLIQIVKEKQQ